MKKMPSALFVIDTHTEELSVKEAKRMGIPVVGIVDTNADPDMVDYVIPANDDAVGSLKLLISYIFDAWMEGKMKPAEEVKVVKETTSKKQETKPEETVIASEAKQSDKNKSSKEEKKTVKKTKKKG